MTHLESNDPWLTRRGFLGGAAGLSFAVAFGADGLSLMSAAEAKAKARNVGAWVRISPDNSIVIITPAAEMGQGSMTSVPTALAEELDADWSKVTLEMAPAEPAIYGYASWGGRKSMGIYGSLAVMRYFTPVRIAGAQVRRLLLMNAAARKVERRSTGQKFRESYNLNTLSAEVGFYVALRGFRWNACGEEAERKLEAGRGRESIQPLRDRKIGRHPPTV